MKLKNWLFEHNKRPSHLAEDMGIDHERICRLVRDGSAKPSVSLAKKIVAATNGAVTLEDLL
jgi:hypothetical protein